jgi:hypothetical protein
MKERIVSGSVTESAANTFTQSAIALTDYFSQKELDQGVYPIAFEVEMTAGTMSAVTTYGTQKTQFTKSSQTDIKSISNADLLGLKMLQMTSGSAATELTMLEAKEFGGPRTKIGDKMFFHDRAKVIDSTAADTSIYVAIKSAGQAAARTAYYRIRFAIAD